MAIDGEPKNGDFARYIETLVNRGSPSPGQVLAQGMPTPEVPSPGQVLNEKARTTGKAGGTGNKPGPAGRPANTMTATSTTAGAANPPAIPQTLAAQAGKRKFSTGIVLVALVLAWHAVRMIIGALEQAPVQVEHIVPGVFLLLFAVMLFRISRRMRADTRRPPGPLAPLPGLNGKPRPEAKS